MDMCPQHQVKSTLDNLPQKFLLQQGIFSVSQLHVKRPCSLNIVTDLLEYFTQCCDLDTPAQFVTRYCKPTQVVLDSGNCTFCHSVS